MKIEHTPEDSITSSYDYILPEELIAAEPAEKRDQSRLMVLDPTRPDFRAHRKFCDLPDYLDDSYFLVVNNTKVLPARLFGQRKATGGGCEVLLLSLIRQDHPNKVIWSALTKPAKKLVVGTELTFGEGITATILEERNEGERLIEFSSVGEFRSALDTIGSMPLPPYILARRGEKESREEDRQRYQTIFASNEQEGSVAAPTAGLHFTPELISTLKNRGIETVEITLHVGAGTFKPITADSIHEHPMHSEIYEISEDAAETINRLKSEGKKLISVGTTSTRTLESAADAEGRVVAGSRSTDLMISPGYDWKIVDALITNFHLPKSSLLCLVSALTGREALLQHYRVAVEQHYHFYSYGDAMFINPSLKDSTS